MSYHHNILEGNGKDTAEGNGDGLIALFISVSRIICFNFENNNDDAVKQFLVGQAWRGIMTATVFLPKREFIEPLVRR